MRNFDDAYGGMADEVSVEQMLLLRRGVPWGCWDEAYRSQAG